MLHPDAPDEVKGDQHLYAAWRYAHLRADDAANANEKNLSVAERLAAFREEWRRGQEASTGARLSAVAAPDRSAHPTRK